MLRQSETVAERYMPRGAGVLPSLSRPRELSMGIRKLGRWLT
jgi:hypothetical protein